jgi:hypothetical protein
MRLRNKAEASRKQERKHLAAMKAAQRDSHNTGNIVASDTTTTNRTTQLDRPSDSNHVNASTKFPADVAYFKNLDNIPIDETGLDFSNTDLFSSTDERPQSSTADLDIHQGNGVPAGSLRPVRAVTFAEKGPSSADERPCQPNFGAEATWPLEHVGRSETVPNEMPSYAKRRRIAKSLSMSSITRHLGEMTGKRSFYRYIGRTLSKSAKTIRSRCSSLKSTPSGSRTFTGFWSNSTAGSFYEDALNEPEPLQDLDVEISEYRLHYHDTDCLPAIETVDETGAVSLPPLLYEDLPATSLLILARQLPEAKVTVLFQQHLDRHSHDIRAWINQRDERGVSALHLAVAYGFPCVCATLCQLGSNLKARTVQGNSISRFAQAAERSVRDTDTPLYWRIGHLREWIDAGEVPPAPNLDAAAKTVKRNGKRRLTTRLTMSPVSTFYHTSPSVPTDSNIVDFAHRRFRPHPLHQAQLTRASTLATIEHLDPPFETTGENVGLGNVYNMPEVHQLSATQSSPNLAPYTDPSLLYPGGFVAQPLTGLAPSISRPLEMTSAMIPNFGQNQHLDFSFAAAQGQPLLPITNITSYTDSPQMTNPLVLLPESTISIPTHSQPGHYQAFSQRYPGADDMVQPVMQPPVFQNSSVGYDIDFAGKFLPGDGSSAQSTFQSPPGLDTGEHAWAFTGQQVTPHWKNPHHVQPEGHQ